MNDIELANESKSPEPVYKFQHRRSAINYLKNIGFDVFSTDVVPQEPDEKYPMFDDEPLPLASLHGDGELHLVETDHDLIKEYQEILLRELETLPKEFGTSEAKV
jgi:hypothetical protein